MRYLYLLFIILLCLNESFPEIRYVSKTGTSIPPYTSWETAADSIQKCINISQFGDTIYVGNGVYEEQAVMIPGLSLIGMGSDSCIINTADFLADINSVTISSDCLLQGFGIISSHNHLIGRAVSGTEGDSKIMFNKINKGRYGIFLENDHDILNNDIDSVTTGIEIFNSNAIIRNNRITTLFNSNTGSGWGILLGAFYNNYYPVIDSNFINAADYDIRKSFGTRPLITNNILMGAGIQAGSSDTVRVYNNLIVGEWGHIYASILPAFIAINNYISTTVEIGIRIREGNIVKNNVVTGAKVGIYKEYTIPGEIVKYNNLWNNEVNLYNIPYDSTNISVDPMVVNSDSSTGDLDFHLQMYSRLIDAGDPTILDKDSTRSDIGLYGGPLGESYEYQDLAPRAPKNLTAVIDTNGILLSWNRNTESDFAFYRVYRDTVPGFEIDSTKLISEQQDTFYLQIPPIGIDKLYYKLTAVDNQKNVSPASEELAVTVTAVSDEPIIITDYILYQNYPNPFNPSTTISYRLKERGYVKLYVYDMKGELVETLVNQIQEQGYYEAEFLSKGELASGFYFYQIMVTSSSSNIPVFTDTKKMIHVK